MRLKWKYALIINLSVLVTLAAFYVLDDIRARKDLYEHYTNGVVRGITVKEIAENTIRQTVEDEIMVWQAFKPEAIKQALFDRLEAEGLLQSIVNIDITFGEDNEILASFVPPGKHEKYLMLTSEDLAEMNRKGVRIYDNPPVDGRLTTGVILPYRANIISQEEWLKLFGTQADVEYEQALDNREIPDGLREAFKKEKGIELSPRAEVSVIKRLQEWKIIDGDQSYAIRSNPDRLVVMTPSSAVFYADIEHEADLNEGIVPPGLRQKFEAQGILLSQNAIAVIQRQIHEWRITDDQKSYYVWKDGNRLLITTDLVPPEDTNGYTNGYIRVLFDVPDIEKSVQTFRLMHLLFVILVSALLVVIIDMTTTRLILQPLEHMMEIIRHAEAGKLDASPQSYASGEIGRITLSLVRMLRQLQQAHSKRIAALGQLAAGVAHEIRNPLNTIGMTAQHLKGLFADEKAVKPEHLAEAKELLDIVNYEIEQLRQISEQFLTLNRPKELKLEPTDLNVLLGRVLSEFTVAMDKAKVKAITEYSDGLPKLQLDRNLVRQAMFNLIQNSVQAMSKGGRIYVSTGMDDTPGVEGVMLEIRDTGVGIPDDIQERIFDAYFTTKEHEGGIGLGLAITHQIITAHKGRIEMRSKVGMGTAFRVCFPIAHD